MIYIQVNREFSKLQNHFVGTYVVAAKLITNSVTYILLSFDNGIIVHVHRNFLKKCNVTFSELQRVDVLMDQFTLPPKQPPQNQQVANGDANVNLQTPLPVENAPAVVPLDASSDHFQPAQLDWAARPPIADCPRRNVRSPYRLVDRNLPAIIRKSKKTIQAESLKLDNILIDFALFHLILMPTAYINRILIRIQVLLLSCFSNLF